MNRIICFALLVIMLFLHQLAGAKDKIEIIAENTDSVNFYGIDEFYFVHHIMPVAFFTTGLNEHLSIQEMSDVLRMVLYKVDPLNDVTVNISLPGKSNAKMLFFAREEEEVGELLGFAINYDVEKQKFCRKINPSRCLKRWLFIRSGRLIKPGNLFSDSLEQVRLKQGLLATSKLYLYDDQEENDLQIDPLLQALIADPEIQPLQLFQARICLAHYYMFRGRYDLSLVELVKIRQLYNAARSRGIPPSYYHKIEMLRDEIMLLRSLKNQINIVQN